MEKTDFTIEGKIQKMIEPSLAVLGYEVVRVRLSDGDKRKTLQLMIDRADGASISVEDCEKASHQASAVLDVEDPIESDYNLEVSSPGIDRPLTRLKDFARFAGCEAKILLIEKINDQRRFRGILEGIDGDNVLIRDNIVSIGGADGNSPVSVPFDNIKDAKLVLTDELLAKAKA